MQVWMRCKTKHSCCAGVLAILSASSTARLIICIVGTVVEFIPCFSSLCSLSEYSGLKPTITYFKSSLLHEGGKRSPYRLPAAYPGIASRSRLALASTNAIGQRFGRYRQENRYVEAERGAAESLSLTSPAPSSSLQAACLSKS